MKCTLMNDRRVFASFSCVLCISLSVCPPSRPATAASGVPKHVLAQSIHMANAVVNTVERKISKAKIEELATPKRRSTQVSEQRKWTVVQNSVCAWLRVVGAEFVTVFTSGVGGRKYGWGRGTEWCSTGVSWCRASYGFCALRSNHSRTVSCMNAMETLAHRECVLCKRSASIVCHNAPSYHHVTGHD